MSILTIIFLVSGGIVPEQTVKTNLVNAYYRYLRNTGDDVVYYVNGNVVLNATKSYDTKHILDAINSTHIPQRSNGCVDWNMHRLSHVRNAKIYLVTDQSPCVPQRYVAGNTVTSIGMGQSILPVYLQQSCGPCSPFLGCVKGWNWFTI
jgi:hypothetical protein